MADRAPTTDGLTAYCYLSEKETDLINNNNYVICYGI